MSLKILVISFYLPPYDKVGGRRWAKHCKYFESNSVDFHVLAAKFDGNSPWDRDISKYRKKISSIEFKRKYWPYFKRKLPKGLIEKIIWKLSFVLWELKRKKIKGNYYDISVGSEHDFYKKAKQLIEINNINTVILSSGPFSYSTILPELKKSFASLKCVIDFRDYWEDGFDGLTRKQIEFERKKQDQVIDSVDLILSPNAEMQKHYMTGSGKRSFLLPHCVDLDDINNLPVKPQQARTHIQLVYGGGFYPQLSDCLQVVKECLDELNKYKSTYADFFVSIEGYESDLLHDKIRRHAFLGTIEYFQKVQQSEYVLLILPPNRVNAMSSKFFELIALRRPILYFGGVGEVSDFIIKHKLGFHVTKLNIHHIVKALLSNLESKEIPDLNFDLSKNTFSYHTQRLLGALESL